MSDETPSQQPPPIAESELALFDGTRFGHLCRVAKVFADSQLVPKHFQGKLADCIIVLDIADRTHQAPLAVFQAIYLVGGRPGWSAPYLIAQARLRGLSIGWEVVAGGKPIDFERTITEWGEQRGEKKKTVVKAQVPDLKVTAFTEINGKREEITVTMQMAIAEGWANNTKYSTLPELMLRYRSASMLINLFLPEIKLGMPVAEELETIEVEAVPAEVTRAKAVLNRPPAGQISEQPRDFGGEADRLRDEPDKVPATQAQDATPIDDDGAP